MAARLLLRRRRAGAVLLALIGALLFGSALTSLAGARRSSSALDRFLAHSRPEDVVVTPPPDGTLDMTAVTALPQVVAAMYQSYLAMIPVDGSGRPEIDQAGDINPYLHTPVVGPPDAMLRRWVIRGRDLDPRAPDEAVIDEELASARHLRPGDHLPMATFTADQADSLFSGQGTPEPQGPVVDLEITGVVRVPADVHPGQEESGLTYGGTMDLYLSPAFYGEHGENLLIYGPPVAGESQAIALRRGANDIQAFGAAVRALPGGDGATIEFGASDTADAARTARRAIAVETTSLAALGVALAMAGTILLGQGMTRLARGATADLATLRAVGLRPFELLVVAAMPAIVGVALAVVASVVLAVLLSPLTPIGLGRTAEVSPGVHLDGPVLGFGCLAMMLVGFAAALLASVPTVRSLASPAAERSARPSWLAGKVAALGAPLAPTLGARFAVESSGPRRPPLRHAAAVGALSLVVVAGVATYTASLDHLAGHRDEQGATWDLTLGNPNSSDFTPEDARRLLRSPAVAGASAVVSPTGRGSIDGMDLAVAGLDQLGGTVGPRTVTGRLPTADGEVAVGVQTAKRLHVQVGDQVRLRLNAMELPMTVVGTAVLNPGLAFTMEIGQGAVVTVGQIQDLMPEVPVNILLASVAPGVSIDEAIAILSGDFGDASPPAAAVEVVNLHRVRSVPIALAGAFSAAAVTLLAVALLSSVRDRRRDLGVLRAIGATRRQVDAALIWQSIWLYAGALVGIPLGVAVGRLVWEQVVDRLGAVTSPHVPYLDLGRAAITGLLLSVVLAVALSVRAARGAAVTALRPE